MAENKPINDVKRDTSPDSDTRDDDNNRSDVSPLNQTNGELPKHFENDVILGGEIDSSELDITSDETNLGKGAPCFSGSSTRTGQANLMSDKPSELSDKLQNVPDKADATSKHDHMNDRANADPGIDAGKTASNNDGEDNKPKHTNVVSEAMKEVEAGHANDNAKGKQKAGHTRRSAASVKPRRKRLGADWDDIDALPKKKRRKAERKLNREAVSNEMASKAGRKREYRKPPLARFYDKLFPGEYTRKQDLRHTIIVFVIIMALVGCAGGAFYIYSGNQAYMVSSELIIPKTAYTMGQETNVETMLEDNGFRNIYLDEDGSFHAFGTPERVQNYKNDYYQRTVKTESDAIRRDYSDYGIVSIYVEPDWSKMTIDTVYDELNAATATYIFRNQSLNDLVRTYAVWRQINSGGDKMELLIRAADGSTLIDEDIDSADELVSRLQGEEAEQDNSGDSENTGTTDTSTN